MSFRTYAPVPIPQTEPLDDRQAANNAGGYSYTVDKWTQLDRFLILGSEGGTYYVSEKTLTKQNAKVVSACLAADPKRTIKAIVDISDAGRAPKNDPAIFALSVAASHTDVSVRALALDALPKVCRIPTHLFHFVEYLKGQRGWGRGLRRAIAQWYTHNPNLAYHLIKYQSRDGWSNRDVFRKAHPTPLSDSQKALFQYVVKGALPNQELPKIIEAFEAAKTAPPKELIRLIRDVGLTREMLPTEALTNADVWEALLVKMPITALVRNLATMTKVGLLTDLSKATQDVASRLRAVKGSRIHPLNILNALKTYQSGRGLKGHATWTPVRPVLDALNDAFYASFGEVTPIDKPIMLALDISSSMKSPNIVGTGISPREASAALALITATVEPAYTIVGFHQKLVPLAISPKQRLDDVVRYIDKIGFGGTDCAQPMLYAKFNHLPVEGFVTYTDSETWAGTVHPMAALKIYRQASGVNARLIVNGMTATQFSIADGNDDACLDVVGFDLATPNIISDFLRGDL